MEYMLLFHSSLNDAEREQSDPASADYWEAWRACMNAIYAADVVKSGML